MNKIKFIRIKIFVFIVFIAIPMAIPINAQDIGINVNKGLNDLDDMELLERCKTKWIRASLDVFGIHTGEKTEVELGCPNFIKTSEVGYNNILTLRWDWKREDLRIPLPDSDRETEYFNYLDGLLDKYAQHAKIIVVNNELKAESKDEDKVFNIDFKGIPAVVFH